MINTVDPGGGLTIDMERINSQLSLLHEKVIISVDPGGGRLMINAERINTGIVGIARCIMGNPFSSTSELQVHSVCTSFVKFEIYWQKNKEDR